MAESVTLAADKGPGAAASSKVAPRVRFQRAKPNLSGVAGRRQAGPGSTPVVSVAAAYPVTPVKIQPTSSKSPPTVVDAEAVESQVHDRSPPPIRRLLPDQQSFVQPAELSTGQTTTSGIASETSSPSEGQSSSSIVKAATTCSVKASTSQQSKQNVNDADVFVQPSTAAVITSKPKERNMSSRDTSKEVAARKRPKKFALAAKPEKNLMTMFDFIHWNPESNPMVYNEDERRTALTNRQISEDESEIISQRLAEENVDNLIEAVPEPSASGAQEGESLREQQTVATATTSDADAAAAAAAAVEEEDNVMPVPQVKIGPDGNIILDERSLVIETTASKTNLGNSPAVYEHSSSTNYSSYRKKKPCKNWGEKETARFYIALSSVGTDFSLMENFFPKRSRHELKLKFKREERLNRPLVEKAINDRQQFDISLIGDEDEENELDASVRKAKSTCRRRRGTSNKTSKRTSKRMEDDDQKDDVDVDVDVVTSGVADDVTAANVAPKKRKYKRRCHLQIESDSDEAVTEAGVEDDKPSKRKKKALPKRTSTTRKRRKTKKNTDVMPTEEDEEEEARIPVSKETEPNEYQSDAVATSSDNDSDDDGESDEIVDSLLRTTRSGRQPKKNSVFTFAATCRTTRRRGGGRRKSTVTKPLRPIVAQVPNADLTPPPPPLLLSPNQLILLAEKPVSDGSQIIHLLMYNSPSTGGVTPVRRFDGVSSTPLRVPSPFLASEHDSAVTALSNDHVELRTAVTQLSGGGATDVTPSDVAISC